MHPQIDIVVATNRNTAFLRSALESVKAQDYEAWRLIVVDDGSPDPDALAELVRDVISDALVLRQENAGQAAARNRGVSHGSAPFVTFLDDDDVWHGERLSSLIAALEGSPSAVASYCAGWYMDSSGAPLGTGWPAHPTPSRDMLAGLVPIPRIVAVNVRRDALIDVGGFDESFRFAEDDDLILRLLQRGEMTAVPEPMVGYRRHADNITNARYSTRRAASERVIRNNIERAVSEGNEEIANLLRSNFQAFTFRAASETPAVVLSHLQNHRWSDAIADMSWALRHAPLATITATGEKALRRVVRWPKRTQPGSV